MFFALEQKGSCLILPWQFFSGFISNKNHELALNIFVILAAVLLQMQTKARADVAKVCLTDKNVSMSEDGAITLPATTVLEDGGLLIGNRGVPSTWSYEVREGFVRPAAIITEEAVVLKKGTLCADVKVQMAISGLWSEKTQQASENHIFRIIDVLNYPIPSEKPAIEIGKLIDDVSITAIIINDVVSSVEIEPPILDDEKRAFRCRAEAQKLAAHLGGSLGEQSNIFVWIENVAASEASYSCAAGLKNTTGFYVAWSGNASPPIDTINLFAKGGEFLTGATRFELIDELKRCVSDAQKSDANETREFRGVKIECQSSTRDNGGGSVNIFRRFGPYSDR